MKCISNTFVVLAVCWGKIISNFLKFSQMPNEGVLSNTFFSIANFGGPKIISNFLKFSRNTFLCIGILGKLSQIFSKFLKIFNFSQCFCGTKIHVSKVDGSLGWEGPLGGVCWETCAFGKMSHLYCFRFDLCLVGLIRKCSCCGECFVY